MRDLADCVQLYSLLTEEQRSAECVVFVGPGVPAMVILLAVEIGQPGQRIDVVRVFVDNLLQTVACRQVFVRGVKLQVVVDPKHAVVGVETGGRLSACLRELGVEERAVRSGNCVENLVGQLVLQAEEVTGGQVAVEPVRPDLSPVVRV